METSPCCNSVASHQTATNFCTCHQSTAVVPCTKFCSDHPIRVEVRVKQNFHRIWIAMEKPLVKRGPGLSLQNYHITIQKDSLFVHLFYPTLSRNVLLQALQHIYEEFQQLTDMLSCGISVGTLHPSSGCQGGVYGWNNAYCYKISE